ncbi:MAG: hypothetical protein M0P69_17740, partial [Bacteroidales bacterium]|nr:hypothetical protein [Bacteroidales bacterium]
VYREISLCNNDKVYPSGYGSVTFKSYILRVMSGTTRVYASLYILGSSSVLIVGSEVEKADGLEVPINIKFTAETCTFELTVGTVTDTYSDTALTFQRGYIGFGGLNGVAHYSIKNLQISGTRIYQKPIHRGAMLETYHDGTQEVVGTTFIDDCQWDRSEEYVSAAGWTHNAANGYYSNTNDFSRWSKDRYGEGIYEFIFHPIANATTPATCDGYILFFSQGNDIAHFCDNPNWVGASYILQFTAGATTLGLSYNNGVGSGSSVHTYIGTFVMATALGAVGTPSKIRLEVKNNVAKLFVNDIEATNSITLTQGLTEGYFGFCSRYKTSIGSYEFGISDIKVIAASSDATNGIAACIPPIGGGARYGEQEKVYKQLVNSAKFGEYKTTALIKTTNADAEAIEMYFKNTTDTTNIATDDTDTLAISLSDTNYAMSTKDLQLLHGDRSDTIEVSVRKTSAATEVSPACYVTDLMILPKVEG